MGVADNTGLVERSEFVAGHVRVFRFEDLLSIGIAVADPDDLLKNETKFAKLETF